MKHIYLKWMLPLLMLILACVSVSAQIVLHDATDITQTKATLSAVFPDINSEHGFQYKYGTLPEIDEFSQSALSSSSDPVRIENECSYPWSVRSSKGWIESNKDLPVGAASEIQANVNLSTETEVSFEWSVDSEEGIGILYFMVDGLIVESISGIVDFKTIKYLLTAGKHNITWRYQKTKFSNVGLDLGKVRNILFYNTTPGEWITVSTLDSKIRLNDMYPNQSYLFRAFDANSEFSTIGTFRTEPITISDTNIVNTTQTTAKAKTQFSAGDAEIKTGYYVYSQNELAAALSALLSPNSDIVILDYVSTSLKIGTNSLYNNFPSSIINSDIDILRVKFILTERSQITFNYKNNGNGYVSGYFKVDGTIKSIDRTNSIRSYSIWLEPGEHTLTWGMRYTDNRTTSHAYSCDFSISSLYVKNVDLTDERLLNLIDKQYSISNQGSILLENLKPNSIYYTQFFIEPNFESSLENRWEKLIGAIIPLTTLPPYCTTSEPSVITQTKVSVSASFDKGDAELKSCGLQYRHVDSNIVSEPKCKNFVLNSLNIF